MEFDAQVGNERLEMKFGNPKEDLDVSGGLRRGGGREMFELVAKGTSNFRS